MKYIFIYLAIVTNITFFGCKSEKELEDEDFLMVDNATHHLIFKELGSYASFPRLAIDPTNEYLYTFFTVKDVISHAEGEDSERHISMESQDGGMTWRHIDSIPPNLQDSRPGQFSAGYYGSEQGGAFEVPDGALVRIGHNWRRWFPKDSLPQYKGKYSYSFGSDRFGPGPDFFAIHSGGYMERSEDGGKIWQRKYIPELDTYSSMSSPWSYDQLPDGTIIRAFFRKISEEEPARIVAVMTRDGKEAKIVDVMGPKPGARELCEETLVHTTSKGVIWMLTRVHNGDSTFWQAVSKDGGYSWSVGSTGIRAWHTPASGLVQLNDGRLVLIFGYREKPFGIHALVSEDEGLTWRTDKRLILRQDAYNNDIGYVRTVKLKDETIVAVYYYSTAAEVDSEGFTTRSIVATRFKVPKLNKNQ